MRTRVEPDFFIECVRSRSRFRYPYCREWNLGNQYPNAEGIGEEIFELENCYPLVGVWASLDVALGVLIKHRLALGKLALQFNRGSRDGFLTRRPGNKGRFL